MKKFYLFTTMCLIIALLVGCADNSGNKGDSQVSNDNQNQEDLQTSDNNQNQEDSQTSNNNQNQVSTDGWLSSAQAIYNKIDLGLSKEDVRDILGEPDNTEAREVSFDNEKYTLYEWDYSLKDCLKGELKDTYYDYYDEYFSYCVSFIFKDDELTEKTIDLYSDDIIDIYLNKELDSKVEDLNELYNKIEEGMKLSEVEEILGTAYFEDTREEFDDGSIETTCTWYDKKENYLSIIFNENNRVDIIGDIDNWLN